MKTDEFRNIAEEIITKVIGKDVDECPATIRAIIEALRNAHNRAVEECEKAVKANGGLRGQNYGVVQAIRRLRRE